MELETGNFNNNKTKKPKKLTSLENEKPKELEKSKVKEVQPLKKTEEIKKVSPEINLKESKKKGKGLLSKALDFQDVQDISSSSNTLNTLTNNNIALNNNNINNNLNVKSPNQQHNKHSVSNTSIEESIAFEDTTTEA